MPVSPRSDAHDQARRDGDGFGCRGRAERRHGAACVALGAEDFTLCRESRPYSSPMACLRWRCDGAQTARRSPLKGPSVPSANSSGSIDLDAPQARLLCFGQGAQGRRLWLTPKLGRSRGELGPRRSALGALATFDPSRCAPVREPTRLAQRSALAATSAAHAHRLPPPH